MSKIVTVSSEGRIVIPREIREAYGLLPGAKVQIVDYGGHLSLAPIPDDPIEAMTGMFARQDDETPWTDLLLAERRRDREREASDTDSSSKSE